MTTVMIDGQSVDFDSAVELMDADLREQIHANLSPCGEQDFVDAYCAAHLARFGVDFSVN
jgi:hypothetical protein